MKISVCIPFYEMHGWQKFLTQCINSVENQTYRNFEIVITEDGKMAENTNSAIRRATGDIIKILYMDDYLAHENVLQNIIDTFTGGWHVSGCAHDNGHIKYFNEHRPSINKDIGLGVNTIGSPSVIAFENKDPLLFDESMTWLLDCDYYCRLIERYGPPTINNNIDIIIGVGPHQATNILSDDVKLNEHIYMQNKYDPRS